MVNTKSLNIHVTITHKAASAIQVINRYGNGPPKIYMLFERMGYKYIKPLYDANRYRLCSATHVSS